MRCAQLLVSLLALTLVGGAPAFGLASTDTAAEKTSKQEGGVPAAPLCASLATLVDPGLHPAPEIASNWVLGPITQRGGTVELLFFRYRRANPIDNADVGPLSIHLRASFNQDDADAAPSFRWEGNWRGSGDAPPDLPRVTQWVEDFVQAESKKLKTIFANAPTGGERTNCYAGFTGTSVHPNEKKTVLVPATATMNLVLAEALLMLVLLLFLTLPLWTAIGGQITWIGLGAGAFLIRWFGSEATVYHENHHGFVYLEAIARGDPFFFADLHSSFLIVHHHLQDLLRMSEGGVFLLNALCSASIAPLLGILFSMLTKNRWAGYMAGIFWALCPVAIRLAPTECMGNFSVFFLLLGVVCAVTADQESSLVRRDRVALYVAGILSIALGAQSRALTLAHPIIALGLFLAAAPMPTRKHVREGFLLLGCTLFLSIPWFITLTGLVPSATESGPLNLRCVLQNLRPMSGLLLNPEAVSPTLVPLALVGVASLKGRDRQRILLLVTLVGAFVLSATVCGGTISQTRHQLLPLALLSGAAGAGAIAVTETLIRQHNTAGRVVGLLLALSPLLGIHHLQRPIQAEMEYGFLHAEVLPRIQATSTNKALVVPAPQAPIVPIPRSWWQRHLPGTDVRNTLKQLRGKSGARFLYVGLACHWTPRASSHIQQQPDLLPGCAHALSEGAWTLVAKRNIPVKASVGGLLELREDSVTLGLYREDSQRPPEK